MEKNLNSGWWAFRHLPKQITASWFVLLAAIVMDVVVLSAFLVIKTRSDLLVIYSAMIGLALGFLGERLFQNYRHGSSGAPLSN